MELKRCGSLPEVVSIVCACTGISAEWFCRCSCCLVQSGRSWRGGCRRGCWWSHGLWDVFKPHGKLGWLWSYWGLVKSRPESPESAHCLVAFSRLMRTGFMPHKCSLPSACSLHGVTVVWRHLSWALHQGLPCCLVHHPAALSVRAPFIDAPPKKWIPSPSVQGPNQPPPYLLGLLLPPWLSWLVPSPPFPCVFFHPSPAARPCSGRGSWLPRLPACLLQGMPPAVLPALVPSSGLLLSPFPRLIFLV